MSEDLKMNEDDFELEFEKTKEHFADVAEAYERWKADGKEPALFVPPEKHEGFDLAWSSEPLL